MPTLNRWRYFLRLWTGCETGLRHVTFVGYIDTLIRYRIVIKAPHVQVDGVFNAHAFLGVVLSLV